MTNQALFERAIEMAGSASKLAQRMGVTKGFVTNVRNGHAELPLMRAIQIEQITEGSIKFDQLLPDFRGMLADRSTDQGAAA